MLTLFKSNNLSAKTTEYSECSQNELSGIEMVFECYFKNKVVRCVKIKNAGIFSDNWCIHTETAKYVLKSRWGILGTKEKLNIEIELMQFLKNCGFPVPLIFNNQSNSPFTSYDNKHWILFEHIDGNLFSRNRDELFNAAHCHARLSTLLNNQFSQEYSVYPDENRNFLADTKKIFDKKSSHLDKDMEAKELYFCYKSFLEDTVRELMDQKDNICKRTLVLHADYHPLNILFSDNRVRAVLDFEDVITFPVSAGVGFASYKFVREYLVDCSKDEIQCDGIEAIFHWKNQWNQENPNHELSVYQMKMGAKYRVMSLIYNNLYDWIVLGDTRRNFDLVKQIGSLLEIDEIF